MHLRTAARFGFNGYRFAAYEFAAVGIGGNLQPGSELQCAIEPLFDFPDIEVEGGLTIYCGRRIFLGERRRKKQACRRDISCRAYPVETERRIVRFAERVLNLLGERGPSNPAISCPVAE